MRDRRAREQEFDSVIGPEGTITIPPEVLRVIGGGRVRVFMTVEKVARALAAAGVTEEEVRRIAGTQLESREHVQRFLLSEGSVARYGKRPRRRGRA